MIQRPVTINYLMDENTQIAVLDGKYVKFEGDVPVEMLAVDVMNEYVAAQAKIPAEFPEVREAVQTKIDALQAVL